MNEAKRNLLWVIPLLAIISVFCMWLNTQEWAFSGHTVKQDKDYTNFTCYMHNYTISQLEPMTRYICLDSQVCYFYQDRNGTSFMVLLTECIESVATIGNKTIRCNDTVENCETLYNLRQEGLI